MPMPFSWCRSRDRLGGMKGFLSQRVRMLGGHLLRLAVVVGVAWLMNAAHQQRERTRTALGLAVVPITAVQHHIPQAARFGDASREVDGAREVLDEHGFNVGTILQTSPSGDTAIGFSGPTDLLVVCDPALVIAGIEVISSGDTRDHVRAIENDERFWASFVGIPLAALAEPRQQRAVAGATLTSRAITEALTLRMGGAADVSRFETAPTQADIARLFPDAALSEADAGDPSVIRVRTADGIPLGWALRISPAADRVIGYQGPTDAVVGFDTENRVAGVLVLESFDNAPYVGYVRDDRAFPSIYAGMTVEELAGIDPKSTGVEGVSGATMTSQAIAEGIVLAAQDHRARRAAQSRKSVWQQCATWLRQIEGAQWGAIVVMLLGVVTAFTRARGMWVGRKVLPVVVLAYLGFGAGALLSLGQFVGWVQAGVPTGASVMLVLTAIAMAMPMTTKRNVYCSHLCAHGAAQQLIKAVVKPKRRLPAPLHPWLSRLPWALLTIAIFAVVLPLPLSLVDLEPFDAYLPQVAGSAALAIFVCGLVTSLSYPMAYCRYGCPTGALLDYLRLHPRSGQVTWRDGLLLGCLVIAAVRYWSLL